MYDCLSIFQAMARCCLLLVHCVCRVEMIYKTNIPPAWLLVHFATVAGCRVCHWLRITLPYLIRQMWKRKRKKSMTSSLNFSVGSHCRCRSIGNRPATPPKRECESQSDYFLIICTIKKMLHECNPIMHNAHSKETYTHIFEHIFECFASMHNKHAYFKFQSE